MGRRTWWFLSLLALPAGAAGCDSDGLLASRDALLVEAGFRTSADSYRQVQVSGQPAAVIHATLDNRFGKVLLPVPCTHEAPEWTLERQHGEEWVVAANASCLLVGWAQATVSPGSEYRVTVRLSSRVQPGTYRLVFGILESNPDGPVPVLDGRARSNPFLLTD